MTNTINLDEFTYNHFLKWLNTYRVEEEREWIHDSILSLLEENPDMTGNYSWSELERIAFS
jgi:hypothetical protein